MEAVSAVGITLTSRHSKVSGIYANDLELLISEVIEIAYWTLLTVSLKRLIKAVGFADSSARLDAYT